MTTAQTEARAIDALAEALVILARANIPTDVQELLVSGNPMRSIAPGALSAVLATLTQENAELRAEVERLKAEQPTGDMMDAVRHIMMWLAQTRPTEQSLIQLCERHGKIPPKSCRDVDHVPPKRLMAYWVWMGMREAQLAALKKEAGHD